MTNSSVAIVKGGSASKLVEKGLKLISAENLITPADRVLIKPNYVISKDPSTGITTNTHVISALIEFAKKQDPKRIVVGEGGAGDTEKAFDLVGIKNVAKQHNVSLIDLNKDRRTMVKVPRATVLHQIEVAKTALDSTCIINVPTLKVHHLSLVTLCMKNLMGSILPKSIMHGRIDEKIVDLASIFKTKVKINVVDGLVGAETDEGIHGNPVKMNLLVAGSDMVAVDAVAAAIMGVDPSQVRHIELAKRRGLGISNLKKIKILGESIEQVRRKFKLPPKFEGIRTQS